MKIIWSVILMMMLGTGGAFAANGQWERPAPIDCSTRGNSKDCKITNLCLRLATEGCVAHVGDRAGQHGGQFALEQCFQTRLSTCLSTLGRNSTVTSTNPTDSPDPWDCNYSNTDGRASDEKCRITNFCLDESAKICAEKIGSDKYKPEGQHRLAKCNRDEQRACFRVLD